jgi:hypothetical protein
MTYFHILWFILKHQVCHNDAWISENIYDIIIMLHTFKDVCLTSQNHNLRHNEIILVCHK